MSKGPMAHWVSQKRAISRRARGESLVGKALATRPVFDRSVSTSEIGVYEGKRVVAKPAKSCTVVVLQAKKGKKPPVSIVWHAFPPHLRVFQQRAEGGTHGPEDYEALVSKRGQWETGNQAEIKHMFLNYLEKGRVDEGWTESLPPNVVADSLIGVLMKKRPGAKIRVTLIPGHDLRKPRASNTWESRDAFEMLENIFQERKKPGNAFRVHSVRTRGMSQRASAIGARRVVVGANGRIYRDQVRRYPIFSDD